MTQHSVRVDPLSPRDVEALHGMPSTTRAQVVKAFIGLSTTHLEGVIAAWQEEHPEYDIVQISMGSELRALVLFHRVRVRVG